MPLNERSFEIHLEVIRDVPDRLQMLYLIRQVVVLVDGPKVPQILFNGYVQENVSDLGFHVHMRGVLFEQVLILFFEPWHIGQEKDEMKDVVPVHVLTLATIFKKIHVFLIYECVDIFVDFISMLFGIIRNVFGVHCFKSLI